MKKKTGKQSGWLYVASLVVKLAVLLIFIMPHYSQWAERMAHSTYYDDVDYLNHARCFAESGTLVLPNMKAESLGDYVPTAFRTPGYPLILVGLGKLCQWHPLSMLLVQVVILSVLPVIALSILRRKQWPSWPAWLLAFDPLITFMILSFMTEGWLLVLLLLILRCWLEADRFHWRILSFLLFGIAILVKPTPQFFAVVFLVVTLVYYQNRLKTLVAFSIGMLPVVMWMFRNLFVCGIFCISTQTDNAIWAKYTIEAFKQGVAPSYEFAGAMAKKEGVNLGAMIIDNKFDFKENVKMYIQANKLLFIKYHTLGTFRVLFGTAREHVKLAVFAGNPIPFEVAYNGFMIAYYALLYGAVILLFRFGYLVDRITLFSVLFVGYNLAMIGIYAYMCGGGLKRTAFVPFLYLILAHGATMKGKGWPLGWIAEKFKGLKGEG